MRIAAFQRFPIFDDITRVCDVLEHDLRWAEARGVELALFPECFLFGHSYDHTVIETRSVFLDGEVLRAVTAQLIGVGPTVIIGAFERRGDVITNSAFVIEGGRITGRLVTDTRIKQRQINSQIADLQKQLDAVGNTVQGRTEVKIYVRASEAIDAALTLRYQAHSASWAPFYNARLTTGEKDKEDHPSLTLTRWASVMQRTGEDWTM